MKGHIMINVGNYLEENTQKSRSPRFSCEAFRFQCNKYLRNFFHVEQNCLQLSVFFFLSARSLWERKSIFFCHNYLFVKWVPETMPKCFFRLPVSATVATTGDRFFSLRCRSRFEDQNHRTKSERYQILTIVWLRCPCLGLDPQYAGGFFFLTPNSNLKIYSCLRLSILANRSFDA